MTANEIIIRFRAGDTFGVGVVRQAHVFPLPVSHIGDLLALDLNQIRSLVDEGTEEDAITQVWELMPPLDGCAEVWAAGVTYQRSLTARVHESSIPDVYDRVYGAERPELFLKATGSRVAGDGQPIAARTDSVETVPEPELVAVYNAQAELVGLSVGNDVTARDIEAENPLYLPQAKIFDGSCAIGPGIWPIWKLQAESALAISVRVTRRGSIIWHAESSTSLLARSLQELSKYLFSECCHPRGAFLLTGTPCVPPPGFSLAPGDEVVVEIESLGSLTNRVVGGGAEWVRQSGR